MRARRRDRTAMLRGVPLFADSPEDELVLVAELADEVAVPAGHHLIHEGHRGGVFTVILEGTADVHVGDDRVRTLGPGDFLGEIAMVLNSRSTATVVATSDVRALCLPDSSMQRVLSRSPGLRTRIEHEAWQRMDGSQLRPESPAESPTDSH